jgi:hypothetical protein
MKKQLRYNAVSNAQLLASLNEQFGDFLKDMHHYMEKSPNDPSEAFYRSSKYLLRLFKAAKELFANKINRLDCKRDQLPRIGEMTAE